MKTSGLAFFSLTLAVLAFAPAKAQQVERRRRARPARRRRSTESIFRRPPPKFGGEINLDAAQSKPYWPPTVVPPKGAPNVLLIMTDDAGYGVSGTFGGVIPTPALDRIAQMGLRYTQFHSTALCSPTRAALITGRNHHSVGFGVITEQSTGYPGLRLHHRPGERHHRRDPEAERLRHVVVRQEPQHAELSSTAWPDRSTNGRSGMGFEYFYGFMGGETDQWTPYLFRNTTQIFPWIGKPGYNLTTDHGGRGHRPHEEAERGRARQAVLRLLRARRHPRAAPADAGVDREVQGQVRHGLERLREQIFANQKRLGVIPPNTQLTPWPDDLPKWETLAADEKKLFARQAEVFAAYAAYTDHEIGRVIQAVEDMGKLDNTLIIYISGDNGTSAEGSTLGTPFDLAAIQGINVPVARAAEVLRRLGLRQDLPRTCRWRGRGRSTRRSSGPSRSRRTSAARGRAWRSPGPTASRTPAASAPSSTT